MLARPSRLNRPDIIAFLRRTAVARLRGDNPKKYSLQRVADAIHRRWGIRVHKSTLSRFISFLGLGFAWEVHK